MNYQSASAATNRMVTRSILRLLLVLLFVVCIIGTQAFAAGHGQLRNPEPGTGPDPDDTLFQTLSSLRGTVITSEDGAGKSTGFNLRERVLRTTAVSIGAQAGLYRETLRMQKIINEYDAEMSRIYNFKPLMIHDEQGRMIKPAVISEADGELARNGDGQVLRTAKKMYRIISRPEFVLTPPYWREYLDFSFSQPLTPREALLPKDDAESAIWKENLEKGWKLGIEQAYQISEVRLARLTRDYIGMVRYHTLRGKNIVSEPVIDEQYYAVTGGGDELIIQDTILTIKATSALQPNVKTWRTVPQQPNVDYLNLDNEAN